MVRALDVARWPPWLRDQRYGQVSPSSEPLTVTFPTTRLNCKVLIALGADLTQPWYTWSWTDISNYVRFASGISTTQGRPDWTSTVRTSSGQLTLDNRDGRFTRRNPNGPYYGLLTYNTPIWGTIDPGSGVVSRLQQYVNEWPTRWDRSGKDSTVPIQTAGILRRLAQAGDPKSAMRRAVAASHPVAHWPLEDGSSAVVATSAVVGGSPMTIASGTVAFASVTDLAGSAPTPNMTLAYMQGPITGGSATSWHVEFALKQDYAAVASLRLYAGTSATHAIWRFFPPTAAGDTVQLFFGATDDSVLNSISAPAPASFTNIWHSYAFSAEQVGSNVVARLYVDGVLSVTTSTVAGTLQAPSLLLLNQNRDPLLASAASIAVGNGATPSNAYAALNGYAGEMAHTRIIRVCAEEGVPLACTSAISPPMGAQPVATFPDILRDAEKVDQGVLYEVAWGLGYQSLAERTNEAVSLALDFNQRHIAVEPEPADDDQRLRNRWRITMPSGSDAVSEQTTGPLGTEAGGPGVYDGSDSANVQLYTQLPDQAGWRRHLGTVDEDRWPSIAIRLHGTPDLIPSWVAMPFGGRMTAANPPSQVAPDTIDAVLEGWSERWDPFTWVADLNTSPFSPYLTGVLAADAGDTDTHLLVLTPDTLTLAADVSTSDVTWSINSSPIWTVDPEAFPRLIWWEGEVIRLTNCTGGSAPQTWTVVRSVNGVVKAHLANSSGRFYRPGVLALA